MRDRSLRPALELTVRKRAFSVPPWQSGLKDGRREVASFDGDKPRRRWTGPEKAQVTIGVIGLILALAAIVVQYAS